MENKSTTRLYADDSLTSTDNDHKVILNNMNLLIKKDKYSNLTSSLLLLEISHSILYDKSVIDMYRKKKKEICLKKGLLEQESQNLNDESISGKYVSCINEKSNNFNNILYYEKLEKYYYSADNHKLQTGIGAFLNANLFDRSLKNINF